MFEWKLDRPFAVLDIESTGANVKTDRIIDLAIIRLEPDGTRTSRVFRVNPMMPIPPAATAIHGIRDEDVAGCPSFDAVAPEVAALLDKCDLGGFNIIRFDIPLLVAEFARCNARFEIEGRRLIDAQKIFHRREPRNLTAALAFYCNDFHENAHGAEADAEATIRVLEGQFAKYPDLPRDLDALDRYCNPRDPAWADRTGRLKWENGEIVLNFGKKAGQPLKRLVQEDSGFLKWLLKGDFPPDTQEIVRNALEGRYPPTPDPAEKPVQGELF